MQIDYRNVKEEQSTNPIIPKGKYQIKVVDVVERINENSGNLTWIIKSVVTEGEYRDSKIDDFNTFSPGLDGANKQMFKAFGFPVDTEVMNIEPGNLIDRVAFANVYVDNYLGKTSNKVKRFGGYESIEITPNVPSVPNVEKDEDEIPF
ncbi:MAG: hypothetical protein GY928_20705 [Colwellia sp.]|nr:hypothetical protein [Colwellia sp.]